MVLDHAAASGANRVTTDRGVMDEGYLVTVRARVVTARRARTIECTRAVRLHSAALHRSAV
jgi:hypothetical protein